jgi:hypothetical protein
METVLLVVLVTAAAALCPAMMWWQRRRGRDPACHVPVRGADSATPAEEADLYELRRRREVLSARIAELENRPEGLTPSPRGSS